MKKFVFAILALAVITPAIAHHGLPHNSEPWHNINRPPYSYQRHHHHTHGWGWAVPVLLGGVIIGYEWSKNQQPIVVQQPNVTVVPAPVVTSPGTFCSDWREVQDDSGRVYRERICRSN